MVQQRRLHSRRHLRPVAHALPRKSVAGLVAIAAVLGAGLWVGLTHGGSNASPAAACTPGHSIALKESGTSALRGKIYVGEREWSPDGRRFARVRRDYGGRDWIQIANRDGSHPHNVTPIGGDWGDSVPWLGGWSPDGRSLAFSRQSNSDSPTDSVYVVNADGSGLRLIAGSVNLDPSKEVKDSEYALESAWSPDGCRLAFRKGTTRTQLFVVRPDGSDKRALGVFAHGDGTPDNPPVWSPDGKWIFSRDLNGLTRVDLDGNRHRLVGKTDVGSFELSPDGRWIAFAAYSRLSVVRTHGGSARPLSPPQTNAGGPLKYSFSSDGRRILFVASRHSIYSIYVANSDGSYLRFVSPPRLNVGLASGSFSPDGTQIAFDAGNAHNRSIYLADGDGNHPRPLARGRCPAWSPDGKWIAFSRGAEVDVIKTDGSGRRRLSLHKGCPNWLPALKRVGRGS